MTEKADRFINPIFPAILGATLVGALVGLIEASPDILQTSDSAALHSLAAFLYPLYMMSLVVVIFQAISLATVAFTRLSRRKGLQFEAPPWALFVMTAGPALFAGANKDIFDQLDLTIILAAAGIYMLFVGLCIWQIRRCFRSVAFAGSDDAPRSTKHWLNSAAYLTLCLLSFNIPSHKIPLPMLLTRGLLFAVVLLIAPPLGRLLYAISQRFLKRWNGGPEAGLSTVAAAVCVVLPISFLTICHGHSPQEDLFSLRSRKETRPAKPNSPNVIVLLIDMLRADHLGWYGYRYDTTPNLDRMADEGVVFRNALTECSWTLPATVTLLTGRHPSSHGARIASSWLADEVDTMAEIFQRNGYTTAAFVTNPHLKKCFNMSQGYDYYHDVIADYSYFQTAAKNSMLLSNVRSGMETAKLLYSRKDYNRFNTEENRDDVMYSSERWTIGNVNARALKWVENHHERPFFLYLHYIDVHGPYAHTPPFFAENLGSVRENSINIYDGALRYTDEHIGQFVEQLRQMGVLDNSILLITADHGEEFFEHDRRGHGMSLYEEQLRIPLIFLHTSAFPYRGAFKETAGLTDILPTLVDILGLKATKASEGTSLMPVIARAETVEPKEYRFSESERFDFYRSVRYKDRWKYIYFQPKLLQFNGIYLPGAENNNQAEVEFLFDLQTDPLEKENLLQKEPELAAKLRKKLDEQFSEFESHAAATKTATADKQTQELLKSLGYLN